MTEQPDSLRTDSARVRPVQTDSLHSDTLREVQVVGDTVLRVLKLVGDNMKNQEKISVPSMGDVLENLLPGINDKITHPFAFKQRKKERRQRKLQKILDDYDRVRTFQDLLNEAVERQRQEDEAAKRLEEKGK